MRKFAIFLIVILSSAVAISQIPTDGLVAHYTFDEGDGYFVGDQSGNGLDGEVMGDPYWEDGVSGSSLFCNGVDTYVNCGASTDFDLSTEITLSCWVKPLDMLNGEHNPWVSKGDHAYAIKHWSGNLMEFFIYDGAWTSARIRVDSTYNGAWRHFAGVYDGNELKAYMNGELDSVTALVSAANITTNELWIGGNSEYADRLYEGNIDEVLIYDIALTDEEIMAIYDATKPAAAVQEHGVRSVEGFALNQNYPNPFNPVTKISYSLPVTDEVILKVYDMLGHEVSTLVNEKQSAGGHSIDFVGSDLASGVYYYKLMAGNQVIETKKMVLMK